MIECTDTPVQSTFILLHDFLFGSNPLGVRIPWIIIPLQQPTSGTTRDLNFYRQVNWLLLPPDQNSILQELGGL